MVCLSARDCNDSVFVFVTSAVVCFHSYILRVYGSFCEHSVCYFAQDKPDGVVKVEHVHICVYDSLRGELHCRMGYL